MTVDPPVRPRTELLPFDRIDEYRFQAFSTDFVTHELPGSNPYQYGRRGDAQGGVDVVADDASGTWGFQCRRKKEFHPGDVRECVDQATFPADRYVILLTCEASTAVRDEIRKHPTWQLWDVRDMSRKVGDFAHDVSYRIVDRHFGPAYAREFVADVVLESVTQDVDEYFAVAGATGRLLRYDWRTVGRADVLSALDRVIVDAGVRIAILSGRGGIGKTHVLRAIAAAAAAHEGRVVRYLRRAGEVSANELVGALHTDVVLIVDDAHHREDLGAILAAIRAVPGAKAILAVRPWSHSGTLGALTKAEFDASEIRDLPELRELARDDTRELARQALAPQHENRVDRLVAVSWDSPLVTVVGGRLIADREIGPELLDRQEDFRRAVFTRFEADLTRPIVGRIGEQNARRLMDFLSAVGPIRLEDQPLVDAAAAFLEIDPPTFVTAVGLLDEGGVLLRRGRLLRITPDVLSDHILHQACVTAAGIITGYAERVFDAVAIASPGTVLASLAELDWRQAQTDGPDVFSGIWLRMLKRLVDTRGWERAQVLDDLAKISYFQPARIREFVEAALATVNNEPRELADDVRVALPKLLRGVSYSLEHLPRAIECLWVLGRDDERPTNQYPDHGMRVLVDIAGYGLRKPIAVGRHVVDAVRRWIGDPSGFSHKHSPLDVLDPVLEKSGHESTAEGAAIHFHPFVLEEKPLRHVRDAAIALLVELSERDDVRVRLRVVESLRDALREPLGYFGQEVTEESRAQWHDEQLRLLDVLEKMIGRDAVVDLKIRDALDWHCRYRSADAVRERARAIAGGIEHHEDFRLTVVLSTSWDYDLLLPFEEDVIRHMAEGQALMRQMQERAAADIVARYPGPGEGAAAVSAQIQRIESLGLKTSAGLFFVVLSRTQTDYVTRICQEIVAVAEHPLSGYLAALIDGAVERDPVLAIALAWKALESGNEEALASLAAVIGGGAWRRAPGIWDLAAALASHGSIAVRFRVVYSILALRDVDEPRSARLLASIDYGGNERLADQVFSVIGEKHIPLSAFTDAEIDDLVQRLEPLNEVGEYWITQLLDHAAKRRPQSVARLFIRRTAIAESQGPAYRPVPWDQDRPDLGALEGTDGHADLLREVRDDMLQPPSKRKWDTAELFGTLSVGFGPTSLRVLNEWIESGDVERIVAAAVLLKDAPWEFVFTEEAFVAHLLDRAREAGKDCYRRAGGEVHSVATGGNWQGTPGEPAPRHVQQRDRANQAASRYAPESPARRFYESVRDNAIRQLDEERVRDAEEFGV